MACDNQGDRNLLSEAKSHALACHETPSLHLFLIVKLGFYLTREVIGQGRAAALSGRRGPWEPGTPGVRMEPTEAASQRSYMHWSHVQPQTQKG